MNIAPPISLARSLSVTDPLGAVISGGWASIDAAIVPFASPAAVKVSDAWDGFKAPAPSRVTQKSISAELTRPSRQRLMTGEKFIQLAGEDGTALGFNAHGGHGCISVTSNVAPRLCAEFQGACLKGDYAAALKLQDKLLPLHTNLFIETNPSPAKYALSLLGKCGDTVRLPLVPLSDKSKAVVRDAMVHAGLIN